MKSWFRVPSKEDSEGYEVPDFTGHDIKGYVGKKLHPQGDPKWLAKVEAPESVLQSLSNEPGVQRLDNIPQKALNNILGDNRTVEEWNQSMDFNRGNV